MAECQIFCGRKRPRTRSPLISSHKEEGAVRSRNRCCPGSKTGLVCCPIGPVAQCKACPWSPRAIGPKWNLPSPGKGGGLATQSGKARNPSPLCVQLPLRVGVSKQSFPTSSRAEGPLPVLQQSTSTSSAGGHLQRRTSPTVNLGKPQQCASPSPSLSLGGGGLSKPWNPSRKQP